MTVDFQIGHTKGSETYHFRAIIKHEDGKSESHGAEISRQTLEKLVKRGEELLRA